MRLAMGFAIPLDSDASEQEKKGFDIDLEIGANSIVSENSCIENVRNHQKVMSSPTDISRVHDMASENGKNEYFLEQDKVRLSESSTGKEKLKIKSLRKPKKPPKPPKVLSLDAAEQKMAREMSELAIQKRLRMERMKAIRNMKKGNEGSNYSKLFSLFVTVVFCAIIIWQKMALKDSSFVNAHASHHEPSLLHHGVQ